MRNIEIKAKLKDFKAARQVAATAADGEREVLEQVDTFFKVETGRLKLRCISGEKAELIYYNRPDKPGPSESKYEIVSVSNPEPFIKLLSESLGILGEVKKCRYLYLSGRTRIHLDRVEGLGDFMELEVVLNPDESSEKGVDEANRLMKIFGISEDDLISHAYVDLLNGSDK